MNDVRGNAGYNGAAAFLAGGGELGALCRAHDWSRTSLGRPEAWPQSLKTAVRVMLTSRQPIWVGWGSELLFFYNDAYKTIIGGKHPWALGRPTAAVWSEIWDDIEPLLATAMGGVEGIYVEDQLLIMERNGYPEETYYTFSYSPVADDEGRAGGIICANTDDTNRVIGERQLALLRDLSAAVTDARSWQDVCERSVAVLESNSKDLPFALLYVDDGSGTTLSLAAAAGIAPGHAAAPTSVMVDSAEPWPFAAAVAGGELRVVEDLARHFGTTLPHGAWNEAPARAALAHIPSGRNGVLIVGLNPYRLFDERYRDFVGLVAGQIGAAIANADAYDYQRRRAEALAELDRSKTAFFANLSHEFRTPLTLMLAPLEELLADNARHAPDVVDSIRVVHRNSLRLLKLVNALLDFSRIEAGRMTATFEPTDLGAFTAELASNFRSATGKAGLALEIDSPHSAQPVYVDRDMWEKIVLNLLSNAFKFTFDGAIAVRLSESDDAAELVVSDTGTGIPPAELPRLFERFHRIEGARSRTFEGSGIGLALVKELVELHGGSIRADSEVGRGTTFHVRIPLGIAHLPREQVRLQAAQDPVASKSAAFVEEALRWLPDGAALGSDDSSTEVSIGRSTPVPQARAHILIAEDNADMRAYVSRLLGAQHRCETVADGEAALERIREQRPDLLLTDIMMPRLDGFGLIRAIRADESLRDLPIIALSARAGEEASVEGLSAGADDYLVKPFSAREMMARVDGALAMARVRREMAEALRDEARTLEAKVVERTAELEAANQRLRSEAEEREKVEFALRQSQKMEAVGKLTGGVAHDFNNLLQVVGGNLQLQMKDVAGNERSEQRIRNALAGFARGSKLAAQLLAFGRRQPLTPKVVNLGRFVRGLDDLLRRALGDGVEIETVITGGLWNVLVDTSQVENALLNLAINARDAMSGHGRLTIEAGNATLTEDYTARHADVVPGQYVMLGVTDTGTGIPADVIEHVFEPFFTTKPEGQGTGLGLSMVYGFVKQSGGHIAIYSEVGHGTTIRIYLPRVLDAEDVVTDVDAGPVAGGSETVLVVEDDETVRETVVELLSDLGYSVLKARDAQSALAIVESGVAIDVLFTDVVMPGPMRSPDLARKARERLPNLAILFTSGYTDNAIVHGGRVDPGVDLLSKPYRREALARKIRHVLRNQQQAAAGKLTETPRNTPPPPGGENAMASMTILYVEDDESIRNATVEILRLLGHTIFEAADAQGAMKVLEQSTIDILMTDISLPGMSGEELAADAARRLPNLRIIYATGFDASALARDGMPAQGAVLLRKPYDRADLISAIQTAWRREPVATAR